MDDSSSAKSVSITSELSNVLTHFSVFNIQGLVPKTVISKVPYVSDVLHEKNSLFINLTETWLEGHTEAELHIDGYKLF